MLYCIYPLGHLLAWVSVAPTELNSLLSACSQGFISGFVLISPWALQEYRPFRALCQIICCFPRVSYRASPSFHPGLCGGAALTGLIVGLFAVSPGFHIGLCLHFTLGFAGVSPLQGSLSYWLCFPRVLYRALPSFHPGLCRSVALSGLFVRLFAVSLGFHIGLCPHFTLGYAGVPPFQGSLSDCLLYPQGFISGFALISPWAMRGCRPYRALCRIVCGFPRVSPHFTLGYAGVPPLQGSLSDGVFAVLCRGIVFVKCVWGINGLLRLVVFLYLFVVVLGRLFVGLIVAFGQ